MDYSQMIIKTTEDFSSFKNINIIGVDVFGNEEIKDVLRQCTYNKVDDMLEFEILSLYAKQNYELKYKEYMYDSQNRIKTFKYHLYKLL